MATGKEAMTARTLMIAVLLALAPSVHGNEMSTHYATVDSWHIRVDASLEGSCFAFATYKSGSTFRMALDMREESEEGAVFAVFGNPEWKSIEYGKSYPITVQFGSGSSRSNTKARKFYT